MVGVLTVQSRPFMVNPVVAKLVLVECDPQAVTVRHAQSVRLEIQRLGQQIGLVVMRAEDVGRIGGLSMFDTAQARCSIAAEPIPSSRLLPT